MIKETQSRIVAFIFNRPKTCLVLSFLTIASLLPGLTFLRTDFTDKVWYDDDNPRLTTLERFQDRYGKDDQFAVGIVADSDLFTPRSLETLYQIHQRLEGLPQFAPVQSIFSHKILHPSQNGLQLIPLIDPEAVNSLTPHALNQLRQRILNDPDIVGLFVDTSGQFTVMHGTLDPATGPNVDYIGLAADLRNTLKPFDDQFEFHFAGSIPLTGAFGDTILRDLAVSLPLLYGLFSILLLVIFRHPWAILLPYTVILPATLAMMGTMGYLGFPLNTVSGVAPTTLLTVAIADAVHLMHAFFRARRTGFDQLAAARAALEKNLLPTLLTSLTTVIAYASFAPARMPPIAEMGILVACGVVFAWLATFFILGPILILFPISKSSAHEKKTPPSSFADRWVESIRRWRHSIVFISVMVAVSGFLAGQRFIVNMDPFAQFKSGHPIVKAMKTFEDRLGAVTTVEIMIEPPIGQTALNPEFLENTRSFASYLESRPAIHRVQSLFPLIETTDSTEDLEKRFGSSSPLAPLATPYLDEQHSSLRLRGIWDLHASREALSEIERISDRARSLGLDATVTGRMPLFHFLTPDIVETFFISFQLVFGAIFLLFLVLLRSLRLALACMAPNLLPLLAGALVFAATGYHVDMGTVIVASVCLGIAVDDSIHFIVGYRNGRSQGLDATQSILYQMRATVPALAITTLLTVVGFLSFLTGDYLPNVKFGGLCGLVIVLALVADVVVLPALLLFGKRSVPQPHG